MYTYEIITTNPAITLSSISIIVPVNTVAGPFSLNVQIKATFYNTGQTVLSDLILITVNPAPICFFG